MAAEIKSRRVRVAVGVVLLVALLIAAVWAFQPSGDDDESIADPLPLVVLVSGYGGDGDDTEPLVAALRADGRDVAVFPQVGDNTGDLEEQARILSRFIDTRISPSTGTESESRAAEPSNTQPTYTQAVDVVGFSAGGVVTRLWASDFGGAAKARRILTIAAPHHGTRLAGLANLGGFCEGACAQLIPGSDLLERLNEGDETPAGPDWVTIWSESDRTVSPVETADLEGSLGFSVQSVCPDARTGHQQLPDSVVIVAALNTTLGIAAPSAPTPEDVNCQG